MKIRIHETDFEGHPVDCTGEYFSGKTALDIVEAMKMNPFNASLTPAAFMRRILDANGQKAFSLPDELCNQAQCTHQHQGFQTQRNDPATSRSVSIC